MRVLCIGDVIGSVGCAFVRSNLPELKRKKEIDVVIINAENSADSNGITPWSAEYLFSSGADLLTTGNHCYKRREAYDLLDNSLGIIRPANYPDCAPGRGWTVVDKGRFRLGVINMCGLFGMKETYDNPFYTVDKILANDLPKNIIIDFHAESTAEKRAFAEYVKGRVSAVFGTHTHVQTADEQLLGTTGFITDVGMTGPINSVIGSKVEISLTHYTTYMPARFEYADGDCMLCGVIFDIDHTTGRTTAVERVNIR